MKITKVEEAKLVIYKGRSFKRGNDKSAEGVDIYKVYEGFDKDRTRIVYTSPDGANALIDPETAQIGADPNEIGFGISSFDESEEEALFSWERNI